MTATTESIGLAKAAAHAADELKATTVIALDVSEHLALTDIFVIASADNERQVNAIVDEVEEKMRRAGYKPARREGTREGRWTLLDYVDIVVHVQHSEERVYYALDRLWKDCPTIPFVDAALPEGAEPQSAGESRDADDPDDVDAADGSELSDEADPADEALTTPQDTDR